MNNAPLIQQALGNDWDKLPSAVQNHYQLQPDQQTRNVVAGMMHIYYPAFVKPILWIVRLMGGLIDLKGDNRTLVSKNGSIKTCHAPCFGNEQFNHQMVKPPYSHRGWNINKATK